MARTDLLPSMGGMCASVVIQKSHTTLQPWHVCDSNPQPPCCGRRRAWCPGGRVGEVTQARIPQGVLGERGFLPQGWPCGGFEGC